MPATQPTASTGAGDGAVDALARAHAQVRAEHDLQFQLPSLEQPKPPPVNHAFEDFIRAIAPILNILFWAGVVIVAALVIYFIVVDIMRRLPNAQPKQSATPDSAPTYRPSAAKARTLLQDVDRLAAEGRFGEAVRVLLHRSIDDIELGLSIAIGRDATSREIARLNVLSPNGRDVFSQIAFEVEMSLFGGRTVSADDFARCRAAYADFALADRKA